MNLYPEMFISKWHLFAVVLILIAWAGLLIGKYERKTVLRSGIISSVFFYIMITLPVATITFDEKRIDKVMFGELDKNYEAALKREPRNAHLVTAAMGAFPDDGSYDVRIYVGNYSSERTFQGNMKMTLKGKKGEVLEEYVFEDLVIEPGKKKRIEKSLFSEEIDKYNYQFFPKKQK